MPSQTRTIPLPALQTFRWGRLRSRLFLAIGLFIALGGVMALGWSGLRSLANSDFGGRPAEGAALGTAPPAGAVPPTRIGINTTHAMGYTRESNFANIAASSEWFIERPPTPGWTSTSPDNIDAEGDIVWTGANGQLNLMLLRPPEAREGHRVRCTYSASVRPIVGWGLRMVREAPGEFVFSWTGGWPARDGTRLVFPNMRAGDRIRDFDCRPEELPAGTRFLPSFIQSVRPFSVIRFMDWQHINLNEPVTWVTRPLPEPAWQGTTRGAAIEHMVELANEARADPWFCIPYNADETFVRNFAIYVRDHLDPALTAHVELGNELWNMAFKAAQQAQAEGLAKGLSTNPDQARLYRYAEKSAWALRIWTEVFASQPKRLVRIVSTQSVWPWTAEQVLGFRDTASYVDALAIAPYFGVSLRNEPPFDDDAQFAEIDRGIDKALDDAVANRAVASSFHKRLIAYEGGQHLIDSRPTAITTRLLTDPRIYAAYRRYLEGWRDRVGDLMVLYNSTGVVGGWGIQEYVGQPLAMAPRRRAAIDVIATLPAQRDRLDAASRR